MRRIKQLLYGIFYLVLLTGIGYWFYGAFLRPAASCFNNVQDAGEEGIDCGGVCSRVCLPPDLRPVSPVGQALFFPLVSATGTAPSVSVFARIQNPNQTIAAKSVEYTLNFYDAGGSVVKSLTGSTSIYAGEERYVPIAKLDLPQGPLPQRGELTLGSVDWIKAIDFPKPQVDLQNASTSVNGAGVTVSGTLTSSDALTLPTAHILAIFYSPLGQAVGISTTERYDILSGEVRSFTIAHPPIQNIDPKKTQVIVWGERK